MYDSVLSAGTTELFANRLKQAIQLVRSLPLTTREDALAEIYSAINGVFALGNGMTPLAPITAFGPARIGDLEANFSILNQDAGSIVQQLLDTESDASGLYNAYASVQNRLRQEIREQIYASSGALWQEVFVNAGQLASGYTVYVDFNSAAASLPLTSETLLKPASITSGIQSSGSLDPASDWSALSDGQANTSVLWNGPVLDLIVSFPVATILNTVKIELLDYQGLVLESFTSTPDGILVEDLLAELPTSSRSLDGNSNRFSGDWSALLAPRHVRQLRLRLRDVVGTNRIQLRNLILSQRKYASTGVLSAQPISTPSGLVLFTAEGSANSALTATAHQMSTDGTTFFSITPGQLLTVPSPFWYRGQLTRLDTNFQQASAPLGAPAFSSSVSSFLTTDLGNGVVVRKAVFSSVSGALDLGELPLAGTLSLYSGASPLAGSNWTLAGSLLTFLSGQTNITLQYQASAYGTAGLLARQSYYSPYLRSVRFQAI